MELDEKIKQKLIATSQAVKAENFKYGLPFFGETYGVELKEDERICEISSGKILKIKVLPNGEIELLDTIDIENFVKSERTVQETFKEEGEYDYEFELNGVTYTSSLISLEIAIVSTYNEVLNEFTFIGVTKFRSESDFVKFDYPTKSFEEAKALSINYFNT